MKKKLRKLVSKMLPKGNQKERLKLLYYNFFKPKNVSFGVEIQNEKVIFKTQFEKIFLNTNEALYHIFPDFNYYQHFYKVKCLFHRALLTGYCKLQYLAYLAA